MNERHLETDPTPPDGHTRREFCAQATRTTCAVALGLVLESCGGSPTSPSHAASLPIVSGTRGTAGVTVAIDGASPLSPVGGAALVQTSGGNFLVAHASADTFIVLSAICTHQTCTITGINSATYVCPCHGSTFDFNGRVLGGPAPSPLRQYPAQVADGVLTIAA